MKLHLFPEYYQGLRKGPHYQNVSLKILAKIGRAMFEGTDAYREGLADASACEPLVTRERNELKDPAERRIFDLMINDSNICRAAVIAEACERKSDNSIYMFNTKFMDALGRMNVELRPELLPEKPFYAHFAWKPGTVADVDGKAIIGAYVNIMKPRPKDADNLQSADLIFRATAIPVPDFPEAQFGDLSAVISPINFNTRMSDGLDQIDFKRESMMFGMERPHVPDEGKLSEPMWRAVLNAAMYLHSLNPDVTHMKPVYQQTAREQKDAQRKGFDLNNTRHFIRYVSWNYGKDREYSVDGTTVRTHLRWQPCGPGRGQTKLIMINEHERKYKKKEELKIK